MDGHLCCVCERVCWGCSDAFRDAPLEKGGSNWIFSPPTPRSAFTEEGSPLPDIKSCDLMSVQDSCISWNSCTWSYRSLSPWLLWNLSFCLGSSQGMWGRWVPVSKRLLYSQPVALWWRQWLRGQQWRTVRWVPKSAPSIQMHDCSAFNYYFLFCFSCQTCVNVQTRSSAAQTAAVSLNIGTAMAIRTVRMDQMRKTAVSYDACVFVSFWNKVFLIC